MLVEREALLLGFGIENAILIRELPGDDQQLLVAAPTVLLVLQTAGTAGLTEDQLTTTGTQGTGRRGVAQTYPRWGWKVRGGSSS